MPIQGTPLTTPTPTVVTINPAFDSPNGRDFFVLSNIVPAISKAFGKEIVGRMRACAIKQGQTATIYIQVVDQLGDPVDLSTSNLPNGTVLYFKGRFREVIGPSLSSTGVTEVDGGYASAPQGYIALPVPEQVYNTAGIYYADVGVYDSSTNKLQTTDTVYLYVEPNLFGGNTGRLMFPLPSIQEARLRLRDSGPEENLLLRELEFDLAELCEALILCVNWWNTSQPPIDVYFNTITYPFYMPSGYISQLMRMAALRYMRNHLPYSAAGVSVDDQNKFQPYLESAKMMQEEYEQLIRQKKVQINMEMAMTSSGSSYGYWRPY